MPYEQEEWGSADLPSRSPEFLSLNPNGMVPVIQDEGFVLWESNTICRYLASRAGRDDLLTRETHDRARVEQWMDWQAAELNSSWRYAFMALVRHSPVHSDGQSLAASIASWNHQMRILDAQLEKTGRHVAGEAFTLADVVIGLSTHRWMMTPMRRPVLPAVLSYYERLSARPAFLVHGRNGAP